MNKQFALLIAAIFGLWFIYAWTSSENQKDFALKCSELGGASIYNGQHWVCLGVKTQSAN